MGDEFRDILEERRSSSDFQWVRKHFDPVKTNGMKETQHPALFKYYAANCPELRAFIEKRIAETGQDCNLIGEEVEIILREIGFAKNMTIVRSVGYFLIKMVKKNLNKIYVCEMKMLEMKRYMNECPVMLLPTHRSYSDFILMTFLNFNYNMDLPIIVSGLDFMGMFGMATVLRNCGAMYMRRTFRDDPLYGAVFKAYFEHVVERATSPVEFFIEGTRSRYGKALTPKLGLLKLLHKVLSKGSVRDILLVPVAISYDRVLEENLFAREMLGVPKPKESTRGMLKAIKKLSSGRKRDGEDSAAAYGNVFVNFGTILSMKEFLDKNRGSAAKSEILPKLAHVIVRDQQKVSLLTHFNATSAVILRSLLQTGDWKDQTLDSITEGVADLEASLRSLGAIFPLGDIKQEVSNVLKVHKHLVKISDKNLLCVETKKYESDTFVRLVQLQYYANPCVHWVANAAFLFAVLKQKERRKGVKMDNDDDDVFVQFQTIRGVFQREFILTPDSDKDDFEKAKKDLTTLGVMNDSLRPITGKESIIVNLRSPLTPYMEGMRFVASYFSGRMEEELGEEVSSMELKKEAEEVAGANGGNFGLFYALSGNFLKNCVADLRNIGALVPIGNGSDDDRFRVNKEKLKNITRLLEGGLLRDRQLVLGTLHSKL